MIGTWLGRPIRPIVQPACGPRSDIVAADPCGCAYIRDCRCGWKCPIQPTIDAAQAAYDEHRAAKEAAA